MAFSQKGANYVNRAHIQNNDRLTSQALDDIASKVQAVSDQTNASISGKTLSPKPPTAISILGGGGFASLTITDNNPAAGTAYIIEYSTTPNFLNPVRIDNGISQSWKQYLIGLTLYFRVATTFYTSELSSFIYFGSASNPTPTTF